MQRPAKKKDQYVSYGISNQNGLRIGMMQLQSRRVYVGVELE